MFGLFNNGKVKQKTQVKKHHGLAFWIVGLFTLAIEIMLGVNAAFLADQSLLIVCKNMLDGTPIAFLSQLIALVGSLFVGASLMMGGMWTFGGFIDSLDDARAYIKYYGTSSWPVWLLWLAFLAIIGIDITTLLFRQSYFASRGESALMGFFIILIFLPPVLGPLLHVLENTPRHRREAKARREVEAIEADDTVEAVRSMSPELRRRLLEGDTSAFTDYYEQARLEEENAQAYEQAVIEARAHRQAEAERGF